MMEVTINTKQLRDHGKHLLRILQKKTVKPILRCVRMKYDGTELSLMGTNMIDTIKIEVAPAKRPPKPFDIVFEARELLRFIDKAPGDTCRLKETEKKLKVTSGGVSFSVPKLDPADFPDIHIGLELERRLTFDKDELGRAINAVITNAAPPDGFDNKFSNIFIDVEDDKANFVATDGYRLAIKETAPTIKGKDGILSISLKSAKEITSLLEETRTETADLFWDEKFTLFRSGPIAIKSNMMHTGMPNYKDVIPDKMPVNVDVDHFDFVNNLKVAQLSNEERVIFTINDSGIEFKTKNNCDGMITGNIKGKTSGGAIEEIGFNPAFFTDITKNIPVTRLNFIDENNPCVIENDEEHFTGVIMPVRIRA